MTLQGRGYSPLPCHGPGAFVAPPGPTYSALRLESHTLGAVLEPPEATVGTRTLSQWHPWALVRLPRDA